MPNQWFRFKQFTIYQDRCAMKVGTDSILLGAWANCNNSETILDIGTGTGILSLMMAQRCQAFITGIEIEEESYKQATENIIASPWRERIKIIHQSVQDYSQRNKFDLIISNPPFFQNSLNAPDMSRTFARHNLTINFEDLINAARRLLNNNGIISLIWPIAEGERFISLAEQNKIYCHRKAFVKPNPEKSPHRILIELGFKKSETIIEEIVIENGKRHSYSEEYIALTNQFYLNMK